MIWKNKNKSTHVLVRNIKWNRKNIIKTLKNYDQNMVHAVSSMSNFPID